jgi:hypothetical protein
MLLSTRGLLGLKLTVPIPPNGDTFEWMHGCSDHVSPDATWYIDGSLFDGTRSFSSGRAVGFGVVVVSSQNDLLAYGRGVPPCWVKDAAGAEAWAFAAILRMCPELPSTMTDCYNVLRAISDGRGKMMAASSPLARVWMTAFNILDDYGAYELDKVTWMPAHNGQGSIGRVFASNGKPLTAVQWRANRLVDLLAKSAARPRRLPREARKLVETAAAALEYSLAKLGAVTHAANHYRVSTVLNDGSTTYSNKRDSSGMQPTAKKRAVGQELKRQRRSGTDVVVIPAAGLVDLGDICLDAERTCRSASRKRKADDLEASRELLFQEYWSANRPALKPKPPGEATARFDALRARVIERQKGVVEPA